MDKATRRQLIFFEEEGVKKGNERTNEMMTVHVLHDNSYSDFGEKKLIQMTASREIRVEVPPWTSTNFLWKWA